jgi:hypothetical protein
LAYFRPLQLEAPQSAAGTALGSAQNAETWLSVPFNLAQALQKQATDKNRQAPVWRGALSHALDAQSPFLTREISLAEAEILLHERRGSSSALSVSAVSGSTPAASAHSVWADEREMATWSRVMDQSARDSNPLAAAQAAAAATKPAVSDAAGAAGAASSAGGAGDAGASSVSSKGDDSSSETLSRREEDEQRWREVKRRYEADRLREAGIYVGAGEWPYGAPPSSTSNSLLRALGLLWTLMAAGVGALYLYWALAAPSASRARRFAGPGGNLVAIPAPPESFLVWLARVADGLLCCRRGGGAAQVAQAGARGMGRMDGGGMAAAGAGGFAPSGLIDPIAGPSDRSWNAQRHLVAEPMQQRVYVASPMRSPDYGSLQRIPHEF